MTIKNTSAIIDTAKTLPKMPSKAERMAEAKAEPAKAPNPVDIPVVNGTLDSDMGFAVKRKVDVEA